MLASLRNHDGDSNENGKKAMGLDKQNNNLEVHHVFWHISLPWLHDY